MSWCAEPATKPRAWAALALLTGLTWMGPASAFAQEASPLTLSELALKALDHHPRVRAASHSVVASTAALRSARAALFPTVTLRANTSRFQEPMVVAPLHAFDPTRPPLFAETLVQGAAQLGYSVFDGGRRRAMVRQADQGIVGANARQTEVRADVLASLVGAFSTVALTRTRREAAERRLEAVESEVGRAEQMLREGAAPRVELLRAEAARAEALAELTTAVASVRVAERELARLTGLPATDVEGRAITRARPTLELHSERTSIDGSPALRAALARAQAADHGAQAARANRLPHLQVVGAYNQFGAVEESFVGEWQVGLQVSYPLFTGGARGGSVDRAQAEASRTRAEVADTRMALERAHDRAVSQRQEAASRANALRSLVTQREEIARIEALSLAEGQGVQRDALAAESQLYAARYSLAQAEHAELVAAVTVARLEGVLSMAWITSNLEERR